MAFLTAVFKIAQLADLEFLTEEDQSKLDKNPSAWSYLILDWKDEAFSIVVGVDDEDVYQA